MDLLVVLAVLISLTLVSPFLLLAIALLMHVHQTNGRLSRLEEMPPYWAVKPRTTYEELLD